ncbi:MAG: MMPL family transporter [Candidatus Izemoplasmatales bacterium]|nr:MMPL family transporter [Candidatus Izemoplasmatales bacterium]
MKNKVILCVFLILAIVSGILITQVKTNYDLQKYLPDDSEISESLKVYKENFGVSSTAYIAIDESDYDSALLVKSKIQDIQTVKTVIFADDILNELTYSIIRNQLTTSEQATLDTAYSALIMQGYSSTEAIYQLASYMPEPYKTEIESNYHDYISDSHTLYQVIFSQESSSKEVEEALNDIKTYLSDNNYDYSMKGEAVSTIFTKNTISSETTTITLIIIPIIFLILLLLSKSVFDILIFGIVAGISIIINLGTNVIFPDISYITQSMAIALQLAISLDYIIFMINSYHDNRSLGLSVDDSIKEATKKTKRPVIASALTTGASFLALIIMRFQIGWDIGLVFTKAIFISLISTIVLIPILLKIFAKLIDKTKRKTKIIDFTLFARLSERWKKYRYIFLGIILIVIAPLVYLQTQNDFTYGVTSFSGSKGTSYYEESEFINDEFGENNNYVILTSKNDLLEGKLYQDLISLDFVENVDAGIYYKSVISDPMVLSQVTESFYSDDYALFNVKVKGEVESEKSFSQYEIIKDLVDDSQFSSKHVLGETTVSYYMKDIIVHDFTIVLLVAIALVILIIFFSFKNLLIPFILIAIIEIAVFVSMSLINFFDQDLVFLAYLIVTTILLGATIDYAILFSKRYMEERETHDKNESIKKASLQAAPSIITSALLFIVAGLVIFFISSITSIAQIGLLIAIGAFTSMIFVLLFLPQTLYIFDKFIVKSKF